MYFCIYEKDYEQYVKLGTPLEEADIINRFEIRLRNERAYYAVRDLLTYYDAEQTAFSIINQYVRFVDEEPDKRKNDWKLNDRWAWFIGDNRQSLKLTTKPEPYTLDRTLRWVQRQVAPTLKMLKKIEAIIRKTKFEDVKDALLEADIEWFSYYDVRGIGKARQGRIYRGVVYDTSTIERILISIVVRDKNTEKTVQAIIKAAQTGEIGDGRIFVIPIEDAIRIRTAERGDIALYNAEQER